MLHIYRGAPGSGKSTLARQRHPFLPLIEADNFFIGADGIYRYDPRRVGEAHAQCQWRATHLLANGNSVVIANTFTRLWEMSPYMALARVFGHEIKVYRCTGVFQNVHGVPDYKVQDMWENYEPYPGEIEL